MLNLPGIVENHVSELTCLWIFGLFIWSFYIPIQYLYHFNAYDAPQYLIIIFFVYVGTAKIIRGDRGNENLNVAETQRYFRCRGNDSVAGDKCFLYGKSVSNQV